MNEREAFDKWADDYGLDFEPLNVKSRRDDCFAAWQAALSKLGEPFGYIDADISKDFSRYILTKERKFENDIPLYTSPNEKEQFIVDEVFIKNVEIKYKSIYWQAKCRKGLWSVSAPTKDKCMKEARHYFIQYYQDGEYDLKEGLNK